MKIYVTRLRRLVEIHPMITPDSSSDTHVPVVTAYRRTLRLSLTSSPTTFQTRSEDSPKGQGGTGEGLIILLD
jgi:hypothetical protein